VSGDDLACFTFETLAFSSKQGTLAAFTDGVNRLAIFEEFEAEENGGDTQSGDDCDRE
jgi:hypothetical protein